MADLGPRCRAVGLTEDNLETKVAANEVLLTNGIMLELFKSKIAMKGLPRVVPTITDSSLRSKIRCVKKRVMLLKKNLHKPGFREKLDALLDEAFKMPVTRQVTDHPERGDKPKPCQNCVDLLEANNNLRVRYRENLTKMENHYQARISELEKNIKYIRCQNLKKKKGLLKRIDGLDTKLEKVYDLVGCVSERRHIFQKIKHLKAGRNRWKSEYLQLNKEHKKLQARCEKRRKNERNWRVRMTRCLRNSASKVIQRRIIVVDDTKVNQLIKENEDLQEKLVNMARPIETMRGKQYSPAIREVSCYLQDLGVAGNKCSEAIRKISECLHGEKLGRLPSRTTQGRIASEKKALSTTQEQDGVELDDALLHLNGGGTTTGCKEMEISTSENTIVSDADIIGQ